jgi:hypothetical protein
MREINAVHANQGWREATTLAQLGEEVLVEYEMPAGTTALRQIDLTHYRLHLAEALDLENLRVEIRRDWTKREEVKQLTLDIEQAYITATQGRSISYTACPKRWIKELNRTGIEWLGLGQGRPWPHRSWGEEAPAIPTPSLTSQLTLTVEN